MSQGIWTRCGARANVRRLGGRAWRVVEAQHVVSTRKLVESAEDQSILEDLVETAKPPPPRGPGYDELHYLLASPFRHPPLAHGSRFSSRDEPSLWYGSARLRTALAETAYYRWYFLEGSAADLTPLTVELTAFRVPWRSSRAVDLGRPPFDRYRDTIASPSDYRATQTLGRDMRGDGVQALRYPSARDPLPGTNVAILDPRAFGAPRPDSPETWRCVATRDAMEFVKADYFERRVTTFRREDFLVDGALPAPAP